MVLDLSRTPVGGGLWTWHRMINPIVLSNCGTLQGMYPFLMERFWWWPGNDYSAPGGGIQIAVRGDDVTLASNLRFLASRRVFLSSSSMADWGTLIAERVESHLSGAQPASP